MNQRDLDGKMVWAEAHNYTRAGIWLLQVLGDRCILSDCDGNSSQVPVDTIEMRTATVGELVHEFFEHIFPELADKEEELVNNDQARYKIALAAQEIFKQNQRKCYLG